MSKSIYDEALQELKDATTDLEDLEIIHSYDVSKIETALKQAQKQEKLLDLYKQLVNENLQINLSVLEKIKELFDE